MSITHFLNVLKESNYNLIEAYKQAPNETLTLFAIIVLAFLVIYFFINRAIKESNSIKNIKKLQDSKSFDEYKKGVELLSIEISKRGQKVLDELNSSKESIHFKFSKFAQNMTISQKIDAYQNISKNFSIIAQGSKKLSEESFGFFNEKSKELLEENLIQEISFYSNNVHFCENEVENVNAIVKYAHTLDNPKLLIDNLILNLEKFSFGYNSELFKFIEKLDEENSKEIYKYCKEKIEEYFNLGEKEISINILDYLYEKDEKQKVYDYIKVLKLENYLQQLHNLYFNKKEDINLDLAFIANPTQIENDYKKYLDESLTNNWRDPEHIEFISKSPGVIEVLGHIEFRTLIERIDNIKVEKENRKMIEDALIIAKRAESIALEAKSLNKKIGQKID